jgi:DNA-binding SARP family transcriptional activator
VNVRILGPPAVCVAGAWLPLRSTKPHALFAYLAYRDAPVRRAEMATLMWPDADPEHAQCDVRQALSNLCRGPFGAFIGRDRTGVWLCGECDVHAFRAAVAEGRWGDAFALHAGPLLLGFEIDDADEFSAWLASERSVVAGDWRRVCRALGREAVEAGCHDDAQRYADLLVAADPVDERAVREAMKAAMAAGDRLGARRRFEELSARLEAEFGLAPEPTTWAVYERSRSTIALPLADGEADAVGSPSPHSCAGAAPSGARRAPGFVGAGWVRAAPGRGHDGGGPPSPATAAGLDDAAWAAALTVWRVRIAREPDPCSGRRLRLHPHDLE